MGLWENDAKVSRTKKSKKSTLEMEYVRIDFDTHYWRSSPVSERISTIERSQFNKVERDFVSCSINWII